ncbi:hypothetical protein OAI12_01720 [Porticoccaceae bacterium]|nr:hypothetical protein [Porticoccaceae bacterium]
MFEFKVTLCRLGLNLVLLFVLSIYSFQLGATVESRVIFYEAAVILASADVGTGYVGLSNAMLLAQKN